LAKKVLPKPLMETLIFLIESQLENCVLVGGTALSGFYIAHRRSDDIDLFTKDQISFKSAQKAVSTLRDKSIHFLKETTSAFYYHANCTFKKHSFTIDIVLDSHFFEVGEFYNIEGKMQIASLKTLICMKSAALVSRCSEKDLYDLIYLLKLYPNISISEFIEMGRTIDRGVHPESMLASLGGTLLREEACDFSLDSKINKKTIYKEITHFQKELIKSLQIFLKNQDPHPLNELFIKARKILK